MQGSSKLTLWIFFVWALSVVTVAARAESQGHDSRSAAIHRELLHEIDDLENTNRLNAGFEDSAHAGLRFDGENRLASQFKVDLKSGGCAPFQPKPDTKMMPLDARVGQSGPRVKFKPGA